MGDQHDISNIQERNTALLADIQGLQTIEQELFSKLEQGLANNSISAEDKTFIVSQIDKISNMRLSLYKNLNDINMLYQGNVKFSMDTLTEQSLAVDIVEKELREARTKLQLVKEAKNDKQRLVEINTYYGERYDDYSEFMKSIVFICIPIIILSILANKGIIPSSLTTLLIIIIIVVAVIYLWVRVVYLNSHDNINYPEYNWNFDESKAPLIDTSDPDGDNPWKSVGITCIGQACCHSGTTYNNALNQCILGTGTGTGTTTGTDADPNSGMTLGDVSSGLSGVASSASSGINSSIQSMF